MWGRAVWVAAPSDVGLKRLCPGSLLRKEGECLHAAPGLAGGTTGNWGHPDRGWLWLHLATTMSLQAPTLPCLVFASKQGFGSKSQNPSALRPFPAARVPVQARGNIISLVASSCKPQGLAAQLWPAPPAPAPPGALGKDGCEIMPENAYFYVSPAGSLVFFRAAL